MFVYKYKYSDNLLMNTDETFMFEIWPAKSSENTSASHEFNLMHLGMS